LYVRSLQIENLRCFQSAELDLQFPGREQAAPPDLPNVNLLLGNNGAGKTTVLKAIALSVLGQILPGSGFATYNLVRRNNDETAIAKSEAGLILHPVDVEGESTVLTDTRIEISKRKNQEQLHVPWVYEDQLMVVWDELYVDTSPAFFLVGYGATRWASDASQFEPTASQRKRRGLRYQRVAGLFEEFIGLTPLSSWLPRLQAEDPDRFQEVSQILNDLLPTDSRFLGEMENDEFLFTHCGVPVPLGALSDGYRAYIGWVSDLLYNISIGASKGTHLRDARGVVLIDEIDLHLHPEWQREVVPTVARALPNLQFVLTTHSPIVAGTLSTKNIFVLEMDHAGASTIHQLSEPIHGLNADQILVSDYFGLRTSRAPGAEDELRELSKRAMSGDSDAAVAFLKKLAKGTEAPAAEKKPAKTGPRPRRNRTQ
jgi:predicted ATP-binding protein involved in virulence